MKRVRHLLEYALVRTALAIFDAAPLRACLCLSAGLANLYFLLDRRRRRTAIDNILQAGIRPTASGARRLARASFRHFAALVVESLKAPSCLTGTNWRERIDMHLPPALQSLLDEPSRGVILATGHVGNWEIAAQALSFVKPIVAIARPLNNPYVNRLMTRRTPDARFRVTPKRDADMRRLMKFLAEGNMLAMMIDQHAQKRGMMVDFFGRPASTHTAVALLPLVTRLPLCFGCCIRTGPMRYTVHAVGPIPVERTGDKDEDIARLLRRLNEELEAVIRRFPEQYLWSHRRWRPAPPAQSDTH